MARSLICGALLNATVSMESLRRNSGFEPRRSQEPKILKIERIRDSRKVRLRLSGEFRSHHLDQVKAEISRGEPIALDLEEVDLVDIEAIRFLNAREDEGISVLHCSPYIQEWMSRERQEEKARTDWR